MSGARGVGTMVQQQGGSAGPTSQAQQSVSMYFPNELRSEGYSQHAQQVPLFDCVTRDETSELRECHAFIQELETRCMEVEAINLDLEQRLESQAKSSMVVDREISEMQRSFAEKLKAQEKETAEMRERVSTERKQSDFILEKLRRTEKELHRMLVRKYDIAHQAKKEERHAILERKIIARDLQRQSSVASLRTHDSRAHRLGASGSGGSDKGGGGGAHTHNPFGAGFEGVREKQVVDSLSDFFGL